MTPSKLSIEQLEKCVEANNLDGFLNYLSTMDAKSGIFLLLTVVFRALRRMPTKSFRIWYNYAAQGEVGSIVIQADSEAEARRISTEVYGFPENANCEPI